MKKSIFAFLGLGFMVSTQAQVLPPEPNYEQVRQQFSQLNLTVNAVAESPMPGILQVFTNRGLFFTSADGQFFIEGSMYDLKNRELVNDMQMRPVIVQHMADLQSGAIEYKAKDEQYVINVFTDPSCGYCRKLHHEMKDYNNAGITVRYMAFPRGGLNSATHKQMQNIWCSKDPRSAMDDAKDGDDITPASCDNPVRKQFEIAQSFGINSTPAIILPSGRVIPGYQPAKTLLGILKSE